MSLDRPCFVESRKKLVGMAHEGSPMNLRFMHAAASLAAAIAGPPALVNIANRGLDTRLIPVR